MLNMIAQWNVLVVDEASWRLIQNVLNEDDILSEKITRAWIDLRINFPADLTHSRH